MQDENPDKLTRQSLAEKLKHAFAIEEDYKISEEDFALLSKLADQIVKRNLADAALLFLESVSPLNFIGSQALYFFQPIANIIMNTKEMEQLAAILEHRQAIPIFEDLIEKTKKRETHPTLQVRREKTN